MPIYLVKYARYTTKKMLFMTYAKPYKVKNIANTLKTSVTVAPKGSTVTRSLNIHKFYKFPLYIH